MSSALLENGRASDFNNPRREESHCLLAQRQLPCRATAKTNHISSNRSQGKKPMYYTPGTIHGTLRGRLFPKLWLVFAHAHLVSTKALSAYESALGESSGQFGCG